MFTAQMFLLVIGRHNLKWFLSAYVPETNPKDFEYALLFGNAQSCTNWCLCRLINRVFVL